MASLSPGFDGWRTKQVAQYLFTHFNVMLIAVEGPGLPFSLCPLKPDKALPAEGVVGHLIASSAFVAMVVTEFTGV